MRALLRKVFGPSKRQLRADLDFIKRDRDRLHAEVQRLRPKAEEGDRLLCREIDKLNDELDGLNHQFAPVKFENDRLVGENATLKAHLESGQRYTKLLADEKERLRLDAVELRENIERLNDRLADAEALLAERNGYARQANEELDRLRARMAEGEAIVAEGLQHVESLVAENERLRKMLCEPEFLKAEARKEGERRIADATMKHWASKAMVMSFADSLGTAENCVELEIGDDEFGRFLVTVQRRPGRSPLELLDEMRDRLRTMEIALEASAELEQKWKSDRAKLNRRIKGLIALNQRFNRDTDVTSAENRRLRGQIKDLSGESEHVKGTCATLRKRVDRLAHSLIGLTKAVSEVRSGRPKPAGYLAMLGHQLDRAVAEADGVLASEQSAA